MPERIQLRKRSKLPPNCVDVGPATPWANPFIIGGHRDGTTGECVAKYERLLQGVFELGSCCALEAQRRVYLHAQAHMKDLKGRDLGCSCPASRPCHAEVLLAVANQDQMPCRGLADGLAARPQT